ncbi:hypothetical protein PMAYCL1PPCAC_30154, partial [Pristionchus mayeri]
AETAFELRLTSRLLRKIVDENAKMRATFSMVEKLEIIVSSQLQLNIIPYISLYVPECKSNLFELFLKLHHFPTQLVEKINPR